MNICWLLKLRTIPFLILVLAFAGCGGDKDVAKLDTGADSNNAGAVDSSANRAQANRAAESRMPNVAGSTNTRDTAGDRRNATRPSDARRVADSNRDRARGSVAPPEPDRGEKPDEEATVTDEEDAVRPEREKFDSAGTVVGDPIKEIMGEDVDGVPFSLSEYRGKVTMIDFWGDW